MSDAYFAGLFDGEGYIRIARWKKPNSIHIRYQVFGGIGMNHRPIIEALKTTYGGSLNMNRHDLRSDKNRIQFTWNVSSQLAATFLRKIRPYSVVKADEIDIALKLQEHIDQNPYVNVGRGRVRENREELFAYREKLFAEITALKKRAYPPLLLDGPTITTRQAA